MRSLLLVVFLAAFGHAHPASLACAPDNSTRFRIGSKIMHANVSAPPAQSQVALTPKAINETAYNLVLTGLPEGSFFALRASGQVGRFVPADGSQAIKCDSQLYSTDPSSTGTNTTVWHADGATGVVKFGLMWAQSEASVYLTTASLSLPDAASVKIAATNVSLTVRLNGTDQVQITLTGNSSTWFGVGIGNKSMNGYALIVDESGGVHERSLAGDGNPGAADLAPSVKIVSHLTSASAGTRTVVLTRGMTGKSAEYYSFTAAALSAGVDVNSALGAAPWKNGNSYHNNQGAGVLKDGGGSDTAVFNPHGYYTAHAVLMTLCFAVLLPIGILMARFKSFANGPIWFTVHRAVQSLGAAAALAGFVVIVVCYNKQHEDHFKLLHAKVGLAAVVMTLLQPLNALVRPGKPELGERISVLRAAWEFLHKKVGYAAVAVAWANIILGFALANNEHYKDLVIAQPKYHSLVVGLEIVFYCCTALAIVVGTYLSITEARGEPPAAPSTKEDLESNLLAVTDPDEHTNGARN